MSTYNKSGMDYRKNNIAGSTLYNKEIPNYNMYLSYCPNNYYDKRIITPADTGKNLL